MLDDTVIVRTSDHGELGSAHRLQNKGTTMYDEQNRVPFTVVYPKRFPRGRRSQALGEAVDLVPTLLEIAGAGDPVARWPWLRGVSLVSALEDPDGAGPRDSVLYRIDEYPITNVGTAVPTNSHIRAIYDGRYKFARYVAVADQHFAGTELVDSQEYELYDTWNDPYEIRNLANDPGYAVLAQEMLAWLYERERAKFTPVVLPAYGSAPIITHFPEPPSTQASSNGIPNPWVGAKPGSYLVVPAEQPNPASFLYEGGLQSVGGGPRTRAEPGGRRALLLRTGPTRLRRPPMSTRIRPLPFAATGLTLLAMAASAPAQQPATPIPGPLSGPLPPYQGAPATAQPLKGPFPRSNPALAPDGRSGSGLAPGNGAASPFPGPLGRGTASTSAVQFGTCASLAPSTRRAGCSRSATVRWPDAAPDRPGDTGQHRDA